MKWMAGFILALMVPPIPIYAGEADVVQIPSILASQHTRG